MRYIWFVFVAVMVVCSGLHAQSPVPTLMSYQGRLTKPDGKPVPDGTYSLTFRIFDQPTGGNLIWEQSINPVVVRNGVFAVLLGNGNPLTAEVFNGTRYLEVQVADDPPLSPRQPMVSVAYALRADKAQEALSVDWNNVRNKPSRFPPEGGAGGDLTGSYPNPVIAADKVDSGKLASDPNSLAKVSGSALFSMGGSIGIGTPAPQARLHITTAGNSPSLLLQNTAPGTGRAWQINSHPLGNLTVHDETGGVNRLSIDTAGNVGIGTTAPSAKVEVNGDLKVNGPIRDRVWTATLPNNVNYAQTEVTLLNLNVTTRGGTVVAIGKMQNIAPGNANRNYLRLYRDGTPVDSWIAWESAGGVISESAVVLYTATLPPGTYTFTLKAKGDSGTRTALANETKLTVMEF